MPLWQWLAALPSRLAATIRHRHLDRDLDDELAFHLAMKQERLAADGVSAEEAAHQAQRRLGNVTRLKEELREVWTFPSLESIGQDLAYALRGLRQQRGFTATVIVVLASVIGLNTTLFTGTGGSRLSTVAQRRQSVTRSSPLPRRPEWSRLRIVAGRRTIASTARDGAGGRRDDEKHPSAGRPGRWCHRK